MGTGGKFRGNNLGTGENLAKEISTITYHFKHNMNIYKDTYAFSLQLEEDCDYDKLSDMVKFLDLELHFGTQKNPGE